MVRITKILWGTLKAVVTDNGFCVMEGFISIFEKGVFGLALIKKWCYWPKGVPAEDIIWHIQNKEVEDVPNNILFWNALRPVTPLLNSRQPKNTLLKN